MRPFSAFSSIFLANKIDEAYWHVVTVYFGNIVTSLYIILAFARARRASYSSGGGLLCQWHIHSELIGLMQMTQQSFPFMVIHLWFDRLRSYSSSTRPSAEESVTWCKQNPLAPHLKKCEGMILNRKIAVDDELTWKKHLLELGGFAETRLQRTSFRRKGTLLFYDLASVEI